MNSSRQVTALICVSPYDKYIMYIIFIYDIYDTYVYIHIICIWYGIICIKWYVYVRI